MYPELAYSGLSWPMMQHTGVINEGVIRGLLGACIQFNNQAIDSKVINNHLVENSILTPNIRADSNRVDAWRDYQQILSELGLIYSTKITGGSVIVTPVAVSFLDGSITYQEMITLQLFRYQYPNGHKTTISSTLRQGLPAKYSNISTLCELQAICGIKIRPATLIWNILDQLFLHNEANTITIDEIQQFALRCRSINDLDYCVASIRKYRSTAEHDFAFVVDGRVRRNVTDWSTMLGYTPIFKVNSRKEISLSQYAIENRDEIKALCDLLSTDKSFWYPTVAGVSNKWAWFDYYENISINVNLIPAYALEREQYESPSIIEDEQDSDAGIIAGVTTIALREFNAIDTAINANEERRVVSSYDYKKTAIGRSLHDSMVNEIARICISHGAQVFSDHKTVDLYISNGNDEFLIEVKSITPKNFIARLRYAIGQVSQYGYLLAPADGMNRRKGVAFTADIPDDSWTIPFVKDYMNMELLTMKQNSIMVYSNYASALTLFSA